MLHDRESTVIAAFLGNAVLAGGNAVAIRYSNRELDPLWGACLRFTLAAALFVGLMLLLRLALPRGRALLGAVAFGLLQFGATFALTYYALQELHAGFGQIVLALVPLLTLLLAGMQGQERIRVPAMLGTLLALAGVAVMSEAPLRDGLPVVSVVAMLAAAACFAQAAVLVRRIRPVHPLTMNGVGMSAGAAALLVASLLAGDARALPERAETWAGVAYLVTMGSAAVFLLWLYVLRRWAASRAAYAFVVTPVVTVLLSAWLDDEPVGASLVAGGLLVLVGVYVGALRRAPGAEPSEERVLAERVSSVA